MKDRYSALSAVAIGAGLALVVSGAIVSARRSGQPDADKCCTITGIDAKTATVTAKVTKTGQTFTLSDIPAGAIGNFKVGATLDLACAVPPNSGPTGASGNAANSGTPPTTTAPKLPWVTTSGCGSNVPRNANTKPVQPPSRPRPAGDCHVKTASGAQVDVACPTGVPIKVVK